MTHPSFAFTHALVALALILAIIFVTFTIASKVVASSRSSVLVGAQSEHGPAEVVSPSSRAAASFEKDQSRLVWEGQ